MREFIFESWNTIMDHNKNPLRAIPDLQVRHMVMQILAFMWSTVFAIIIVNNIWVFMYSAIGHALFVGAVVVTVATFRVAEKIPNAFKFKNGYHSYGRGRGSIIFRDKNGIAQKVPLDPNDPGGEHE